MGINNLPLSWICDPFLVQILMYSVLGFHDAIQTRIPEKDIEFALTLTVRKSTFCDGILRYWKYLSLLLLSLDIRDISRGTLLRPRVGASSWLLCSATSGIWLLWDGSRQDQDCHSGKTWEVKTGDKKAKTARRNDGRLLWSISRLGSL